MVLVDGFQASQPNSSAFDTTGETDELVWLNIADYDLEICTPYSLDLTRPACLEQSLPGKSRILHLPNYGKQPCSAAKISEGKIAGNSSVTMGG